METETLLNSLAETRAKARAATLGDTLVDEETKDTWEHTRRCGGPGSKLNTGI